MVRFPVLAAALLFLALSAPASAGDLDTLHEWMIGSFSSEAQAAEVEGYFDIRLEVVPIWTDREDGPWLYVEQAAASNLDRPYRQRVYHLSEEEDGALRSEVYALPEPLRFAGAWRDTTMLDGIGPGDLKVRAGCAVILRRATEERFEGSTVGKECTSTLRGASYATSKVIATAEGLESWDQGFAESGEQVWGAEDGPYLFLRISKESEE